MVLKVRGRLKWRFWLAMNSKGVAGNVMMLIVATLAIVLILFIFVIGSGVVKKVTNVDSGLRVYGDYDTGLRDLFSYMSNYSKLVEGKFLIEGGVGIDEGFRGSGYEK